MPTEKFTLLIKVNTQAATFSYNIIYHGTLVLMLAAQECGDVHENVMPIQIMDSKFSLRFTCPSNNIQHQL
jgi:hypothetical protein